LLQLNENKKIFPEYYLIKIRNFEDNSKNTLDEWINFLKNEEIPENPKAKGLLKAKETLDYLKMDKKEKISYDNRQEDKRREASIYESTYVIGKIKGEKEGKIEGKKIKALEIAKNLINANINIETIKLTTGLTDIELANIKDIL
jgi:predicted transposase YdaD